MAKSKRHNNGKAAVRRRQHQVACGGEQVKPVSRSAKEIMFRRQSSRDFYADMSVDTPRSFSIGDDSGITYSRRS